MEEVKAYIESGILELYVLGQLNAQEQIEVEAMASKYPEIKREIEAIEIAMEQYAVQNAIQPSVNLENKILEKIGTSKTTEKPEPIIEPVKIIEPAKEAVIVPLNTAPYESKIKSLRIALVACIALLAVSIVALYSAHNQLGVAKDQIASLSLNNEKFTSTVNFMKQSNADLQKIIDMNNDPDWKAVKLAGTDMDPKAKMTVYWHAKGKHVMVDNSKMDLPANDQQHQYQLWAIVNGKPVDLGVFDVKSDSTHILLAMKEIGSAAAFAVTLEKKGGSVSPTMNQMIVIGNVSI
nr:anti-sigma factor [Pedobacter panaciterrae]